MKVLYINSVYRQGSTGKIVADIESLIQEEGMSSAVAYGRGPKRFNAYRICSAVDVVVHAILARLFDRQAFFSKGPTKKLINFIDEFDPDIIHIHNVHGYYLQVQHLFRYLKRRDRPVVWTLHDCWPFTGHCAYFDFVDCNKWKIECNHCPLRREYPKSILFDSSKRNYRDKKKAFTGINNVVLVTPSAWLAGLVNESYLKSYKCIVINNGIDLSVFKPTISTLRADYGLSGFKVVLGVAAPWVLRKGIEEILKLADILSGDYKIVLIGLNQNQIKRLPKGIIGIEKTSNASELAQWYTMADVFINPTIEDNYPTTNLEAMACGTPVITYNTGGSPESVISETGIIIDKYDVARLAEAVYTITNRGKAYYSNNCISHAQRNFDKKSRFKEYISLYKELYSK